MADDQMRSCSLVFDDDGTLREKGCSDSDSPFPRGEDHHAGEADFGDAQCPVSQL
jgi:hypothetical protein